jgi:hypothetical protein
MLRVLLGVKAFAPVIFHVSCSNAVTPRFGLARDSFWMYIMAGLEFLGADIATLAGSRPM